MSYGIKGVTKSHPCPICGHSDWCGFLPLTDYAGYSVICMRANTTDDVIGCDGREYTFVHITKGGNSLFEDTEQRKNRIADFVQRKKGGIPIKKVPVQTLKVVDEVKPLSHERLDRIYRALLSSLVLEPAHRKYLHNEGFSDKLLTENLIKSFPESDFYRFQNKSKYVSRNPWRKQLAAALADRFGDLTGVPGAYLNAKGEWTFYGLGGILFPLYDQNRHIYRLRVRLDRPYLEDGTFLGKYHNFSSYKKNKDAEKERIIVNSLRNGCAANNNWGIYYNNSRDNPTICYITEGEKKGIIANDILNVLLVTLPGVNSYGKMFEPDENGETLVSILKNLGAVILVIAFDADKATNEKVLSCQQKTVELLREEGFILAVADWDISIGKGLDDMLVNGGQPRYTIYDK